MKTTILSLFAACSLSLISTAQDQDFPQWQPEENYPVQLMEPSSFFLKKDWNKAKKLVWTGLFEHNSGHHYTEIADFSPIAAPDPMEYDAEKPKYKGIQADIKNKGKGMILMSSKTIQFPIQRFEWVELSTDIESKIVEYKGITYILNETQTELRDDDGNPDGYGEYRLELSTIKDGKTTTQTLIRYSQIIGDVLPALLFVGDLDGDDKLDFFMDTTNNAMLYQPTLYLSSLAKEGEIVKLAGILAVGGC